MKIEDTAFGTFFPLKDVLSFTNSLSKKVFQAIYALSEDEVTYQNQMLDKVLDAVCNYMLPSLIPAAANLSNVSFTHLATSGAKWQNVSKALKASIRIHCNSTDSVYGLANPLYNVDTCAPSQFTDFQRNLLVVKYALLCEIFQPQHRYHGYTSLPIGCVYLSSMAAIKRTHMGTAAINLFTFCINRQDTIEDIIASFFVDGIPFDGFPEEA